MVVLIPSLLVQRNEASLWEETEIRASRKRGTSASFEGSEDSAGEVE